eukprot:c25090_g1_i1 orf=180-2300(-)
MSRRNGAVNKNILRQTVNTISTKEHKNNVGGQNTQSSKASPSPMKIPKPPLPSPLLSKSVNSVTTKERKHSYRDTGASNTRISKEMDLLPIEADEQSEPLQKSKERSVKAATSHRSTMLEKSGATETDMWLDPCHKSKETTIIEGKKHSNPFGQTKESLGGCTDKQIGPVQKSRRELKTSIDKQLNSLAKSSKALVRTRAGPRTSDEMKNKTPLKPKVAYPNTGKDHECAGSGSTGKTILHRECREVPKTTICLISNDGRMAACSKGGSGQGGTGHFHHCNYPWCAANDPDYAVPYAIQPKKYMSTKRRLIKHQTVPKSKANQMVSNATLDWNRASTSQSTHRDGCHSGIDCWEGNHSCSDDASQFVHNGGMDSVPPEFNNIRMNSLEGNTDIAGGTTVESPEIKSNGHTLFERNGDDDGGNRSESREIESDGQTYVENYLKFNYDASSRLLESNSNGQALFEISCDYKCGNSSTGTGNGSDEIKCNDWTSCESDGGTVYKSFERRSAGQTSLVSNCCYNIDIDFQSPEIKSNAESSSGINCDHNCGPNSESFEVKSNDQITFDCRGSYNGDSDSELIEIESNGFTSFERNVDCMESGGNQVGERANRVNKVRRRWIDMIQEHEAESVRLRKQMFQERKHAGEYLIDSAIEELIHKLAPNGDARVKVLVEAYEIISHNEGDMIEPHHLVGNHDRHSLSHTGIAMHC